MMEELAEAYEANDAVAFGMFDATKNNIEDIAIKLEHYPTLYLFPQGCSSAADAVEFTYGMPSVKKLIGWMADFANLTDTSAIRRFKRTPSLVVEKPVESEKEATKEAKVEAKVEAEVGKADL